MSKMHIEDGSEDHKYFTVIPNYILNHSTLWDREVYIQMKRIAGDDGTCWTSQTTLAKQCGISINRLKKSINYLLTHKWIEQVGKKETITRGGAQEVNEYKIANLWKMFIDFYESKKGVSRDDIPLGKGVSRDQQRGVTSEVKGVSPGDDKEEPLLRRTIEEEKASPSDANLTNLLIGLFVEINPAYHNLFRNTTQRKACERLLATHGLEQLKKVTALLPQTNGMPYFPSITTPVQLEEKWASLENALRKKKSDIKGNNFIL